MAQTSFETPGDYRIYYDDQSFDYKTEIKPIQNYFYKLDPEEVAALLRADQGKYASEFPLEINDPYYGEINIKIRHEAKGGYYLEKQQ